MAKTGDPRSPPQSQAPGVVTATILAMVLTGAFSGALVSVVLARMLTNQLWLAIITAFVAVIVALIVRQLVFGSRGQLYFPAQLDLLHVVVASLIGGLAGHELAIDLREPPVSPLIGATSGLLGSVLMSCFVVTITYRRNEKARG
jgi:hypothetical protein